MTHDSPHRPLLDQMRDEERRMLEELAKLTAKLDELRRWMSKEQDYEKERQEARLP